jgi:hypothetical protein
MDYGIDLKNAIEMTMSMSLGAVAFSMMVYAYFKIRNVKKVEQDFALNIRKEVLADLLVALNEAYSSPQLKKNPEITGDIDPIIPIIIRVEDSLLSLENTNKQFIKEALHQESKIGRVRYLDHLIKSANSYLDSVEKKERQPAN